MLRRDSGRVLTEMTIILPLFIILLLGVVDFSRALTLYTQIDDAAMVAGRTASVTFEPDGGTTVGNCASKAQQLFRARLEKERVSIPITVASSIVTPSGVPVPTPGAVAPPHLLQMEVQATFPCITCKMLWGSSQGISANRFFHFPIETPDLC